MGFLKTNQIPDSRARKDGSVIAEMQQGQPSKTKTKSTDLLEHRTEEINNSSFFIVCMNSSLDWTTNLSTCALASSWLLTVRPKIHARSKRAVDRIAAECRNPA